MSAVDATCTISMASAASGGLRQALELPTRSLVFRLTDGPEAGSGLDGVIGEAGETRALDAGSVVIATVRFPLAREGIDVRVGQRFELWMGRVVGEAVVDAIAEPAG